MEKGFIKGKKTMDKEENYGKDMDKEENHGTYREKKHGIHDRRAKSQPTSLLDHRVPV